MKNENISNKEFNDYIHKHSIEKEAIEWEGTPNPKFSLTLLELGGHHDVATGSTSIFGFVLAGTLIACYLFYNAGMWIGFFLAIIIGISIVLLPDFVKHQRKKNTKYAFTKKKIFFQLWKWGKKSYHVIDLADVGQLNHAEFKDKSGVIHFLPKKVFDFFTYDFISGEKRFYPTFEMIPNVKELHQRIEELRIDRIMKKR